MPRVKTTRDARLRRHLRVRTKVSGTAARPRLCVFRSLNHIYVQVIDDQQRHTLVAASTLDPDIRGQQEGKNKAARAALVGTTVAQRAKAAGISQVVFDRGGNQFHGRIKALADAARAAGLDF